MKTNCILANTDELARTVAIMISKELGRSVIYKGDSCYLAADGTFHFVMMDRETELFSINRSVTPKEIAEYIGVLNWEIVSVPDGDSEELALLFYA